MHEFLSGRRVLVVEDEMMILLGVEDLLADMGCTDVTAAATVGAALAFIDDQRFDVAMLDVNLDGQSSYPVADALALHEVPFLFSTGYGDRGHGARHGDRPVLRKPYREEELAAMLAKLVPAVEVPALA